jgi:hypothetical protein
MRRTVAALSLASLGLRLAAAVAVVLVTLVIGASPCHAFCRTTTSKGPPGYNPGVSGCWTQGVPLAWTARRVPYAVSSAASKQVSLAEATRVADLAFRAWNGIVCGGLASGIQAYDDGPAAVPGGLAGDALVAWSSCPEISSCNPTAHDVIVFDDDAWPYNDAANTLALTTVTFGMDDGRIAQAFTEINSAQQKLTTSEPPERDAFDLQAILTHEAGHVLGLAHATDPGAIMYAFYEPGAIQLTVDDMDAICTVYPPPSSAPSSSHKGGSGCTTVGGTSDLSTFAAGMSFLALGMLLMRRQVRPLPGSNPVSRWSRGSMTRFGDASWPAS